MAYFTAATDLGHHAVEVMARVGGLSGRARVRVVPDLPWRFDFEQIELGPNRAGEPPITWVGARYRHVIRDLDGN